MMREELMGECTARLLADESRACDRIDALVLSALRQLPVGLRDLPVRNAFGFGAPRQEAPSAAAGADAPLLSRKRRDADTQTDASSCAIGSHAAKVAKSAIAAQVVGGRREAAAPCALGAYVAQSLGEDPSLAAAPRSRGASAIVEERRLTGGSGLSMVSPCTDAMVTPLRAKLGGGAGKGFRESPQRLDPEALRRLQELRSRTQDLEEFQRIIGHAPDMFEMMPAEQRRKFMGRANEMADKILSAPSNRRADA